MGPFNDKLAELEVTMVPSPRLRPEAVTQMPPGESSDAPFEGGSRRRHFWCALKEQEVEVEFETRSFLGLSRIVGVRQCTAFEQPQGVACGRRCVDSRYRDQWPSALPLMGWRRALEN